MLQPGQQSEFFANHLLFSETQEVSWVTRKWIGWKLYEESLQELHLHQFNPTSSLTFQKKLLFKIFLMPLVIWIEEFA